MWLLRTLLKVIAELIVATPGLPIYWVPDMHLSHYALLHPDWLLRLHVMEHVTGACAQAETDLALQQLVGDEAHVHRAGATVGHRGRDGDGQLGVRGQGEEEGQGRHGQGAVHVYLDRHDVGQALREKGRRRWRGGGARVSGWYPNGSFQKNDTLAN